MLNSSVEGRSGQLGPAYNHILVFHRRSDWIRQLKNVHRRCAPVNPSCCNY
jgi:hypothetical protein